MDLGTSIIQPEPGFTCQAQCWHNWDQTKQLKMFVLDSLTNDDKSQWGANAKKFLADSARISCFQLSRGDKPQFYFGCLRACLLFYSADSKL